MSNELKPSTPLCSQCGMYHPPLEEGQECPMKNKNGNENNNTPEIGNFIVTMRSIILNNIEKNNINDIEKFKNYLIIELNRIIENYNNKQGENSG
jgi:hypothetical protein